MISVYASMAAAFAVLASAASPVGAGKAIAEHGSRGGAPACEACHGAHLEGVPAAKTPALAGRPADFILARLAHYAAPEGHNAAMKAVATALTPAERSAVAAYIARLPKTAKAAA